MISKKALRSGICLCVAYIPLTALGQDTGNAPADPIGEVSVLGTRLSSPGPQTVDVLTAQQLDEQQPLTVTDALRNLPQITAIEPGGAGGISEVYLRGADANFTTVFINGIQLNDSTDARGGGFDFSSVFPGEIRRIDVVNGPFSALYGSGALAGAINIDTRAPLTDERSGELAAAVGADDYWHLGGSLYGPIANGHAGIGLYHVDFGEPTEGSTREVSTLSGNFGTALGETSSVDLTLRANRSERTAYPTGSGGPRLAVLDLLETGESDDLSAGATYTWNDADRSVTLFGSYFGRQDLTMSPPIPDGVFPGVPASTSDTELDRYTLRLQAGFRTSKSVELGGGVEYQYEDGSSDGSLDFGFPVPMNFSDSRNTISPFVEGRVALGDTSTLYGGLRYDDFSDGDSKVSPRVGYVWQRDPEGPRLALSWGKGRKYPSFYALSNPLIGNPELEPEDSEGGDIGLTLPLGGTSTSLSLSAYQYDYTNLIDFDFTVFRLVNRTRVDTRGAELRLDGEWGDSLGWSVFVASHENKVDGVKNALLHRPEYHAGGSIDWKVSERLEFFVLVQYEDDRPSSSIPGGYETLDSFMRVNAVARYRTKGKTQFHLTADNLFDSDYEAMAGFPSPGRQVRLSVQQRF